ncbi:MAG: response regulator [Candidatus Omnitrophica bacterium]|nr:response regulator [Candidatus Omnitrophota bacterium]
MTKKMLLEKKKIFIVDDDESVCRALSILLVTYGFTVDTYTCAEDFFRAVPNSVPGCLLLDVHMPGLDGWGTQQQLIKSGSSRPVIMMSADKDGGLNERALKAGAGGFLQKPFNDQALVNLIKVALKKKEKGINKKR